jgi:hypothetical protein
MENNRYVLLKKDEDNGHYFIREDGNDMTEVFYDKQRGIIVFSSLETTYDPTTEEMYSLLLDLIVCPLPNLPPQFGTVETRLLSEQNLIKRLMDMQTGLEISLVMDSLPYIPSFIVTKQGKEIYGNFYFIDPSGFSHRSKDMYSKDQAHCWLEKHIDDLAFDLMECENLRSQIEETDDEIFPRCIENDLVKYN